MFIKKTYDLLLTYAAGVGTTQAGDTVARAVRRQERAGTTLERV